MLRFYSIVVPQLLFQSFAFAYLAAIKDLAEKTKVLAEKTDTALCAFRDICFRDFNAYDQMTATSLGIKKDLQWKLRKDYFDHCNITLDRSTAGEEIAACVLTGKAGSGKNLKVAHLLPASTSQEIRRALLLTPEDIWGFRNVLLLSFNIERAFDTCQISFVPHPLRENYYYMKVWNDKVRDVLIWDGAEVSEAGTKDNTIGHYENHLLNLEMRSGVTLFPFKRCLSYQNFICFYKSRVREEPVDFSSELDPNEWAIKRRDLMMMRASLEKDILSESAEVDNEDIL